MKTTLFAVLLITLFSCGKNGSPSGTASPIIGSNSFIQEVTTADITNARTLTAAEAKTIITNNLNAIKRVEVGMKWRETTQTLVETSMTDDSKYCYERIESDVEILEILPPGTALNIEGDAIKVENKTKTTYIEGNDCSGEIGTTESSSPFTYEMENDVAGINPEGEVQDFDLFDRIQVGTYKNRPAIKASITFEGTQYHVLDYSDNPSIIGAHIMHHTRQKDGKTFIIASKTDLLN